MALRAKKPEQIRKRLKLLMYAASGVGKTTAAIQFPKAYIIDTEKGAQNYSDIIAKSGSVVFESCSYEDIIAEVRSLMTERHDYQTLILDSGTPLYAAVTEEAERGKGDSTFKSWADADKKMRRLFNAMVALDMNVIVTSHQKVKYNKSGNTLIDAGLTFDGWKRLDYMFDLCLRLERQDKGKERSALVEKTRIHTFPDQERFPWSYDIMVQRYELFAGAGAVTGSAEPILLCTEAQAEELAELMAIVNMGEDWLVKVLSRAGVDEVEEMQSVQVQKCIDMIRAKVPGEASRAAADAAREFQAKLPPPSKVAEFMAKVDPIPADLPPEAKTPAQIAAAVPDGAGPKARGRKPKAAADGSSLGGQTSTPPDPKGESGAAAISGTGQNSSSPPIQTPTTAAPATQTASGSLIVPTPLRDLPSSTMTPGPVYEPVQSESTNHTEADAPDGGSGMFDDNEPVRSTKEVMYGDHSAFLDPGTDHEDFMDHLLACAVKSTNYTQQQAADFVHKRILTTFRSTERPNDPPFNATNTARRRAGLLAAVILGRGVPTTGMVKPPIGADDYAALGIKF